MGETGRDWETRFGGGTGDDLRVSTAETTSLSATTAGRVWRANLLGEYGTPE